MSKSRMLGLLGAMALLGRMGDFDEPRHFPVASETVAQKAVREYRRDKRKRERAARKRTRKQP